MKKKIFKLLLLLFGLIIAPVYWIFRAFKNKKTNINYSNIVDGFSNKAFPSPKLEKLAKSRAMICAECPFAKKSKMLETVYADNKTKTIQGMYCDVCGCALSAKVRSQNDSCPRGKW